MSSSGISTTGDQRRAVRRLLYARILLGLSVFAVALSPAMAQTLLTTDYRVTLTEQCEEGVVGCDKVAYQGTDRRTGRTIKLRGQTEMAMCRDGVTPCHILRWVFSNGAYVYSVLPEGRLIVRRGNRVVLDQPGQWRNP